MIKTTTQPYFPADNVHASKKVTFTLSVVLTDDPNSSGSSVFEVSSLRNIL